MLNFYVVKSACLILTIIAVVVDSIRHKSLKEPLFSPICIYVTTALIEMPMIGILINQIAFIIYTIAMHHITKKYNFNVFLAVVVPILSAILVYGITMYLVVADYMLYYLLQVVVIEAAAALISLICYWVPTFVKTVFYKFRYRITFKESFYMRNYDRNIVGYCLLPMLLLAAI